MEANVPQPPECRNGRERNEARQDIFTNILSCARQDYERLRVPRSGIFEVRNLGYTRVTRVNQFRSYHTRGRSKKAEERKKLRSCTATRINKQSSDSVLVNFLGDVE